MIKIKENDGIYNIECNNEEILEIFQAIFQANLDSGIQLFVDFNKAILELGKEKGEF